MNKEILDQMNIKVAFSSDCNLRCNYCEGRLGFKPGKPAAMEDFRRTPLETGSISTDTLLAILRELHAFGVNGISATGGEPLLRPDWDDIVRQTVHAGYQRVEITTNGLLLEPYLQKHGALPRGITMIKISLDTADADRFREITRGGSLEKVISGIKAIEQDVYVRANKVLLRSDLPDLRKYIDFCIDIGLKEASFLDLVYYPNRDVPQEKSFFEQQFVTFPEFKRLMEKTTPVRFGTASKIGGVLFYEAVLPNGFKITFKDSTSSRRDDQCTNCPVYCQEGRCLVRIGTDGNLTVCPDYRAELPSIDAVQSLNEGLLQQNMADIMDIFTSSRRLRTIEEFIQKHQVNLKVENEE